MQDMGQGGCVCPQALWKCHLVLCAFQGGRAEEKDLAPNSRRGFSPGRDAPAPLQRCPGRSAIPPLPALLYPAPDGHIRSSVPAELAGAQAEWAPRCWHAVPLAAQAAVGGEPREQSSSGSGKGDAIIALCSHAAAWEWCARPPPPGKAPCWQGPRRLCPGTRLCLPKTPSPSPSAPPTDPLGASAPASAVWPRPGQGGQSRRQAGFGVGGQRSCNTWSLARHKAQSWPHSGLQGCLPGLGCQPL